MAGSGVSTWTAPRAVRQKLQVKEEKTVVLVYNPAGKLIYVEDVVGDDVKTVLDSG